MSKLVRFSRSRSWLLAWAIPAVALLLAAVLASCGLSDETKARAESAAGDDDGFALGAEDPDDSAPEEPTATTEPEDDDEVADADEVDDAEDPPAQGSEGSEDDEGDEGEGEGDEADDTSAETASDGQDGVGDPYYPQLGNSGYDVDNYDIALSWDPDSLAIDATARLEVIATEDLAAFNLDFRGPEISKLTIDGDDAEFERTGTHELEITPPASLDRGQTFVVDVAYAGVPESVPGPFGEELGWYVVNDTVTVVSEPDGASTWFPVNDHPTDKATFTFTVTVPAEYSVAANGILTSTDDAGDGTQTWNWSAQDPMASYLATVNIGKFEMIEAESSSGVPIRSFIPVDGDGASALIRGEIENLPELMDQMEDLFGPYPFEAYGAVIIPAPLNFALENQTMSVFGLTLADVRIVHVHELAHQWFGNSVSPAEWDDVWLNEGFANYSELLWSDANQEGFVLEDQVENSLAQGRSLGAPASPPPDDLFNASIYVRGGLVLHALRLTVGDDAFFEIIETWIDENRNQTASTADFIDLSQRIADQDLGELFENWLFSDAPPEEFPG